MRATRASRWILGLALAALVAPCGLAADDDEDVVLYTNADVEKLTPLSTGGLALPFDEEAWAFVAEFLDDQRARIDAERDWKLERDRVEIEEQRPVAATVPFLPLRVPYWTPTYGRARAAAPAETAAPAKLVPHPMFLQRPPVREFVPGLGKSAD